MDETNAGTGVMFIRDEEHNVKHTMHNIIYR